MFRRFYPAEPASEGERFAEQALATLSEISAAQVQGHFLLHKMDPVGSIDNVGRIKEWHEWKMIIELLKCGIMQHTSMCMQNMFVTK